MSMFDRWQEERARKNMNRELIEGCSKHPSYRYKRKPKVKCRTCEKLFGFAEDLRAWDAKENEWWQTYHRVEQKRMEEWSRAEEARLNCPG